MSRSVVVDASTAGGWLLKDERTPESDTLLRWIADHTLRLVVPEIWAYEVLNLLRTAVAGGRAEEREAKDVLEATRVLPKEVVSAGAQGEAAILSAALHLKLSAYDASYVNLAEARGLDLVTRDIDILRLRPQFPWIWTVQGFVDDVLNS